MSFKFKNIIEYYCGTGKISDDEVDFLEIEHIKTISQISKLLSPSIANLPICEACNLEPGSFWIICNASILDRIRPVRTGKPRTQKLYDALCKYRLYKPKS